MNKQIFIKSEVACEEKSKKMFFSGRASKKAIAIGAIAITIVLVVVLGLGIMVAHLKLEKYASLNVARNGRIMKNYPNSINPDNGDEFVLPQDAAKSGEIAIIVNDLDNAKNSVQNIAVQNGGVAYSTFIAYASGNIKNGSIVVQIPNANFDATLSDIEKIGSQIVQESSRQIPMINPIIYPQAQPMIEASGNSVTVPKENPTANSNVASEGTAVATDQGANNSVVAPAPILMPVYPQIVQDKGYIKVIFADYGVKNNAIFGTTDKTNIENIFGVGYGGQNMRDNIWVVLATKSIVLIVLIIVIVIIAKRIIVNLREIKRNKKTVAPVVKQVVKNRRRAVKLAVKAKKK